ncbi:HAD family hydrolase [Burkholderia sp. MR1-5-21]
MKQDLILKPPLIEDGAGAIIFDCDNTLAETAPIHFTCLKIVLRRYGHELHEGWYAQRVGLSGKNLMEELWLRDGSAPEWCEISGLLPALYLERVRYVRQISAATSIVYRNAGLRKMAVASGGPRVLVEATLDAIKLRHAFDTVVTFDDVTVGKPSPDIFLEAAKRLGVEPSACLVIEDSVEGLEAGRRAGMRVVDIATLR